jgi:hypothetical protein
VLEITLPSIKCGTAVWRPSGWLGPPGGSEIAASARPAVSHFALQRVYTTSSLVTETLSMKCKIPKKKRRTRKYRRSEIAVRRHFGRTDFQA